MYLKAIEIQGFKSFPDKTVLRFGSDITAIVGPNGSGKSNISDAIRWVMGEMSSKALRGNRMEDVIFGGTLKRPQVGFAEVSLILDNSQNFFNMESTEIMVTRRYYRSGNSEYYINRQTARLRDINELFMDTGLGKEGYSNVGQGRIDEILSAKSTDRREIFEEAAGISKFRHRKEDTERKLQQTQDNLLRINDKISELELQVNPLREQAEKAKKYLVLRDELRGLEVTLWLSQLEKLTETAKKAEADYASALFLLDQGKTDLEKLYATAEALSLSLREMDQEAEQLRGDITALEHLLAEKQSDVAVLKTRSQGNEANILRLQTELTAQEGRNDDLTAQILARQNRQKEIEAEKETAHAEIGALGAKEQLALEALGEENMTLSELNRHRTELLELGAELRSTIVANDQSVRNIQDRKAEVEKNKADALSRQESALAEAGENRRLLREAEEAVESSRNAINGYTLRAQGRIKKHEAMQQQVAELKIRRETLDSKIRMYREMEKDYEGYSKATRIVMQEAEKGTLKGIHGPVSKLIRTRDEYTVAIETALGSSMQSIVVATENDGKNAIHYLRRRDGGRATFLPISTIRSRLLQEKGLEDAYGFVGLGSELITFDSKYREIMENLLGRTAIAEDMDSAIAIANRFGHRFRIVTLDGQVLNAGGSMTGGSTAKSSGVLTRANELARMEKERTELENTMKETTGQLQDAARAAAEAQAEIDEAKNALRAAEDDVIRLEQQENHFKILTDTIADAIASADKELQIVEELLSGGKDQNQALLEKSRQCDKEAQELEREIGRCELRVTEKTRALEAIQTQRNEKYVAISALDAEAISNAESEAELCQLRDALSGDKEQRLRLIAEYEEENRRIAEEIQEKNAAAERYTLRVEEKRQELKASGEKRMGLEEKKTLTEKESQRKQKEIMDMDREAARLEQRRESALSEEKQIVDKLWDYYQLTVSTAMEAKVEIESAAAAQKRVAELRRKISALGPVNVGAIEDFQRINERYEYLAEQRDDVEKSKKDLQKIVADITTEMTSIFRVEFEKINHYFGETFTEMFGGGKASLQLEDEEDILSCGIEIKVQPPGKQVKTIMLLSGGEKAFVAIALYFAIMKVRPTPFCMLDEIDAALDDRNVGRFASYLRNLSGKTQFIVITHRRGTMEAADVLYGVTMQEQGISKVLSVDLNQVVRELNIT